MSDGPTGLHLTADWHGCSAPRSLLQDPAALETLCRRIVVDAGLTPVGQVFHRFPEPGGVTGVLLLAESHLALHTWPEHAAVTLDVYVCNRGEDNSARAERVLARLAEAFGPSRVESTRLSRGSRVRER